MSPAVVCRVAISVGVGAAGMVARTPGVGGEAVGPRTTGPSGTAVRDTAILPRGADRPSDPAGDRLPDVEGAARGVVALRVDGDEQPAVGEDEGPVPVAVRGEE